MTHLPLAGGDEFARIGRFLTALGPDAAGVGDDTATIPDAAGALVVSTDTSIDEVHFRRDWISPLEIGWRATAAALSDIAAAGAQPVGALLALSLPNGFGDAALDDLARGVPGAGGLLRALMSSPEGAAAANGPATKFVLGRMPG